MSVRVTNQGSIAGAQVFQIYISPQSNNISIPGPVKQLKGFTKVFVPPGESVQAEVKIIRKYATSFWDEARDTWVEERGTYSIVVGESSACTPLRGELVVDETNVWTGV